MSAVLPVCKVDVFWQVFVIAFRKRKNRCFPETAFYSAIEDIEREYGVEIKVDNEQPIITDRIVAIDFKTEGNITMCMLKWI